MSSRKAIHGPEVQPRPMGQEESELSSDRGLEGTLTNTSQNDQQGRLSPLPNSGDSGCPVGSSRLSPDPRIDRSTSPLGSRMFPPHDRASVSSCPEMVRKHQKASFGSCICVLLYCTSAAVHNDIEHLLGLFFSQANKETKKTSTKGISTALSRRRVSCRELGRPDCDGWLWKKRKDTNVFLAHKWQRLWFVLKGPSLYWYNSPQEEKAEGLVQIPTYSIESAGEHKRKYVFKMCHQRFQKFIFAAENLNDMSKWINCLIIGIQKHRKFHTGFPDSEADCCSETDSEEEGSPSQRRRNKKMQSNTLPRPKKSKMPIPTPPPEGSKAGVLQDDEMGVMIKGLKEGGVSMTGQDQPFTQDQFRRSFIKRNKNPVINEKVHTLRALHSTLKAKEAELLLINKILDDSDLTATKFHQWKERNEELCLEIGKAALLRGSPAPTPYDGDGAEPRGATVTADVKAATVAVEPDNGSSVAHHAEGAAAPRLSLSDGEQLVDDSLLEIDLRFPAMAGERGGEYPPMMELFLGSPQGVAETERSEMDMLAGGDDDAAAADNYFYI